VYSVYLPGKNNVVVCILALIRTLSKSMWFSSDAVEFNLFNLSGHSGFAI
jgi:hypothetical protein